jgi:RimJ/RimL family protein N-acetyltransferase
MSATPNELRPHTVRLAGAQVVLRPLTEADWPLLLPWYNDPAILVTAEVDDIAGYSLADLQSVYRSIAQHAYCFVIEHAGVAVGGCWLQQMNLPRILQRYPDVDCWRVDLVIGNRAYQGRGLGTEAIKLLTTFAFAQERADSVWGCDIAEDNPASLRAFARAGFQVMAAVAQPPGGKVAVRYVLAHFRRTQPAPVEA